ncbi:MAG: Cof-type HAD-IIB family hydrolase [Oscillospiraceae bacterium]|nr:Cof-type HAD-IIB family hydrolase [Oscillospiraceae bacterium]
MLKYKLIAADLDGTLLDGQGLISDRTRKAVEEYHRRGGVFTLATGRMENSALEYVRELNVRAPIIAFNGGKIVSFEDGAVLSEAALDVDKAMRAYQVLRELKKDFVIYRGAEPYTAEITGVIEKYSKRIKADINIIEDPTDVINTSTMKILVIDPKMEYDLLLSAMKAIFGDTLNCVCSDPEFFEILPENVSKGRGLEIIAESLGIPMEQVIAIGDHLNDISMLKVAGLGVAVRNAEEEVLAAADYITSSNDEDGVAEVIEKVIENEL